MRGNKGTEPLDGPPAPVTEPNPCNSIACKVRLQLVLGEVQKANQIVRSFIDIAEDNRVSSERHIQHLKAVTTYQHERGKKFLSATDIERLNEVLQSSDVVMEDETRDTITAGPSTESVSMFSDSGSEYVP